MRKVADKAWDHIHKVCQLKMQKAKQDGRLASTKQNLAELEKASKQINADLTELTELDPLGGISDVSSMCHP
jgi:hypothetical protein